MSQTSANVIAGDDARASDFNKVVADLAEIYAGGPGVPVGGVIYWWSDNTVPLNYKVCDGTVVADAGSPLNGLTLPNMTNRFIRGVAQSNVRSTPVSGGADEVTLTVNQMPAHSHTQNPHSHGHNNPNHQHSIFGFMPNFNASTSAFRSNDFSGDAIAVADNAINGVNGDIIYKTTEWSGIGLAISNATATNQNTGGGLPHNNIPAYRGLVAIMRIK